VQPLALERNGAAGFSAAPAISPYSIGFFSFLVFGSGLDAYNLGTVPITWLVQTAVIGQALHLLSTRRPPLPTAFSGFFLWLLWLMAVTLYSWIDTNLYEQMMPPLSTTPYLVFVLLRFLSIFSFLATAFIVYAFCQQGYSVQLIRSVVLCGSLHACAAFYIYLAQRYGLPEPERNRMGGNGWDQVTTFEYAFHRAMGTFREPSQMAQWLVVPLFLSQFGQKKLSWLASTLIGSALLLTGSLTGILAGFAGIVAGLILTNPFHQSNRKLMLRVGLLIGVMFLIFGFFAFSYDDGDVSLSDALMKRINPILFEGGMKESNRDYVFLYFETEPVPWFGVGLGNANLDMTSSLGLDVVASMLSLYFNTMYAGGIVGSALLFYAMFLPVYKAIRNIKNAERTFLTITIAAYCAWLVIFSVLSEEPHFMFGVAVGLLAYGGISSTAEAWSGPSVVDPHPIRTGIPDPGKA
jgi:hypothetical protein